MCKTKKEGSMGFGHMKDFIDAATGWTPSYTWRSIQQASWIIKKGSFWRIGNGFQIKVWEDNWLPYNINLKSMTERPLNCSVSYLYELIDREHGSWNRNMVNELFLPNDASKIMRMPLLDLEERDALIWHSSSHG